MCFFRTFRKPVCRIDKNCQVSRLAFKHHQKTVALHSLDVKKCQISSAHADIFVREPVMKNVLQSKLLTVCGDLKVLND